jgi:fatty-acyl-CoA synthase
LQNLVDIIKKNIHLERKVCHFYDQYELKHAFSYSEILNNSIIYAKNIKQCVPTTKEPILISLETTPEFLFCFFGIIISGNIPVPVTSSTLTLPRDYTELIKQISESCQAKYIIAPNSFKSKSLIHLRADSLSKENSDSIELNFDLPNDDVCFIQYSSGSTQAPKGVSVTHKNILANLEQIKTGMEVTNKDIICSWLPLHHDMGLIGALLASLYTQVDSHLLSPLDFLLSPKSWLQLVSDKKVSVIVAPNSAYMACVKKVKINELHSPNFENLRLALSGAEPVNKDICEKFTGHLKSAGFKDNVMFPVYGLAECTLAVSFNKVGEKLHHLTVNYDKLTSEKIVEIVEESNISTNIVSCGKALPGTTIEIRKDNGKLLPELNVGEIFVKGPAVVSNYYNQSSHLQNDWLATGDIGFLSKKELFIIGRKKDLIIMNGRNIAALDIETKAYENNTFNIRRTVAFGFRDKELVEQVRIVAEVCETDSNKRIRIKEHICEQVRTLVSLKPENISLIPPLLIKRTTSGKVKRYYIKQMYLLGRVNKWEKNYMSLYYRSQFLIAKIKLTFIAKKIFYKLTKKKQIKTTVQKEIQVKRIQDGTK